MAVNSVRTSPAPWVSTKAALTQPYHTISLEASDDRVVFVTREEPTPPRPFPTFILILEEGADMEGIVSYIELLPAVTNVNVLSTSGIVIVDFDPDEISREEARMLLEDVDGVEDIEEESSSPDETVSQA